MYWQVITVSDEELTNDWALVEASGSFIVVARHCALQAEPGRIISEVMAQLEENHCPASPFVAA